MLRGSSWLSRYSVKGVNVLRGVDINAIQRAFDSRISALYARSAWSGGCDGEKVAGNCEECRKRAASAGDAE